MAIQVKDPNSTTGDGPNPRTGTNALGGYLDAAGVDLGNGVAATLVIAATRTKTTVNASTTSVQLLAADLQRVAASVFNNEALSGGKTLYLGYNGAAAVVGTNPVPPQTPFAIPKQYLNGQINVIWATGGTVAATVLATTA